MRARDRVAGAAYGALLRLLPGWLRRRSGAAMREVFAARLAAAPTLGRWLAAVLHELGGLVGTAAAARFGEAARAARAARTARAASARNTTGAVAGAAPRGSSAMERMFQDLGYAVRTMRRGPSVAVLAVLTLGLGVGASTAMFSVIDGVLLRPLPFERPEQIVLIHPTIEDWRGNPSLAAGADRGRFSYPELEAWVAGQQSFSAVGGVANREVRVPAGEGAETVASAEVQAGVWSALGVRAQYGRLFTDSEEDPVGVAVLTHRFWRSRYGGDLSLVGRDIQVNDAPVRVIGVLPREFELVGVDAQIWRPLVVPPSAAGLENHSLRAIGRLRADVSVEQAEAELAAILRSATAEAPRHLTHHGKLVWPVEEAAGKFRTPLLILMSASALLLLAACASVALLLLGAGTARVRELAVRGALGADQARLTAQLFIESLVISVAAALAGLLFATGIVRVLIYIAPDDLPRADSVGVDLRTFAFTAALAVATAVLVGAFPALTLSRVKAALALRSGAATPDRGGLQRSVVVVQLALATMLLVGAGLLTRTMQELQRVRPGFDPDGLLTVQLVLPYDRMRDADGGWTGVPARIQTYADRIREMIEPLPGVEAVALTSVMPYGGGRATTSVEPEEYVPAPGETVSVANRSVSANYFDVMRIPLQQGRLLTAADQRQDAERVLVVTEPFARAFWPDGRWVGRRVHIRGTEHRVVGVVGDTREQDVRGDEDKLKYFAPARTGDVGSSYIIRTSIPPEQLIAQVRQRIHEVDRTLVIGSITPLRDRMSGSLTEYRYRMRLISAFSVIAAVFALLGVYGVMSRAVARRRQELGVRIALGARSVDIVSLVLGEGMRIGVLGAAAGVAGALGTARVLESMIWGVPRTDPATFGGVALLLLLLALLATLAPALRAARVEPVSTLKG